MLLKKELLKICPYKPGKPIEELQRELGLKDIVKLASNENPIGPSPEAVKAARKYLLNVNRYPDGGSFELKKRLAKHLGVAESNIIAGNGSDEIILIVVRAMLSEGDEVIVARPTFVMYSITSKTAGAKVVEVPVKDFYYDLKAMKNAVCARTKIIFIANPDNPVGTYLKEKEILEFMDGLSKDILVFFDEAYYEFACDEPGYPRMLKYLGKKNIIITRTFSKAYGLAGLRIGYGIADKGLINYLEKVRPPFNTNSLAQAAACAALDDEVFLSDTKKVIRQGKGYLYREFERLGFEYIPSAANFILVDVKTDSADLFKNLLNLGVIVRGMEEWGLDSFIRVTVGTQEENERLVRALKNCLKRRRGYDNSSKA